ncbi:FAD-binding oxidoreductase [Herbaspirillum sp. RTI4]|uniref:FAD-binding oxidoreductase n=1 Tax=Herbaspirillum sp. RTI4 TaxID=3048640 RepID=UPI002AB37C03|nr:FAD-binding oxidoreductase [Herbaspirillum sp. RTI4]MDY7578023.1 FAD-binding oxidoreductase [Herbaspirillum sp. RTI4]MEA9982047.1 FAD-binding oxidoreductase [Herbaspirillum sp. RTI4]
MQEFLQACAAAIGAQYVLTSPADMASYLADRRGRFTGAALAVVRPGSAEETAAIVALCHQFRVPLVPQGGNTGLVLGSVPDTSGTAIVLSLMRLNRIRAIDTINHTMTVEAGCILQHIQQAAAEAGLLFPLALAAQGSCTIGGNLATNAGGTGVLRYGNTRELCLGLEIITAQGTLISNLRGLRKDNTGYDLRHLFIGAEGTLGVISAAVLKLFPQPKAQVTALVAVATPEAALQLLGQAQQACDASLTAFELISDYCLQLVERHFPALHSPFQTRYPYLVLLEISDNESTEHANGLLEQVIGAALDQGLAADAAIASSIAQSAALWALREHISDAQAREGKNIKHDISMPISSIPEFMRDTDALLQQHFPGCAMVTFGHLGDGNLHYNVSPSADLPGDALLDSQPQINRIVYDSVDRFGGSISAEHGLGALKREEIRRYKPAAELQLMATIKQALDPLNLMNPGKVL